MTILPMHTDRADARSDTVSPPRPVSEWRSTSPGTWSPQGSLTATIDAAAGDDVTALIGSVSRFAGPVLFEG